MGDRNIKRVMLLGEQNSGKTCLLTYLLKNGKIQAKHYPTYGVQAGIKTIQFQKDEEKGYIQFANVQLWDTAGSHQFHEYVCKKFYQQMDGFLIVVDLSNQKCLDQVDYWMKQIEEEKKDPSKYVVGIVGNKKDIETEQNVKKVDGNYLYKIGKSVKFYGKFSLIENRQKDQKTEAQRTIEEFIKDLYGNNLPKSNINVDNESNQPPCKCSIW